MLIGIHKRQAMLSWLFVGTLVVLCGTLGLLQYRWLGEVSVAERQRLRETLNGHLGRLSQDFNRRISAACVALMPPYYEDDAEPGEARYTARYLEWKETSQQAGLIRRVALVTPGVEGAVLRSLDLERGTFAPADWPEGWNEVRERLTARMTPPGDFRQGRRPFSGFGSDQGLLIELPRFRRSRSDGQPPWFGRRETEWLVVELDAEHIRTVLLPNLLRRHLGSAGVLDYQVEVVTRSRRPALVFQSGPKSGTRIETADASVGLFEIQFEQLFRRPGPPGGGESPQPRQGAPGEAAGRETPPREGTSREAVRGRLPGSDWGRWQMLVQHRAGSLEAVVDRARWRNLSVTGGILLLMLASAAALLSFTRRSQRLAELQMDFVAGVSHELRTPLTVIRTAAYNLRGRLASNPSQVEKYGALIQKESERLTEIVEQVLRFATAKAGRPIREPEPLSVEAVIEDSVESSKAVIEDARGVVEMNVEPGLPLVMGDPKALRHAIQNLLSNAAKYGTEGNNWIGVFAVKSTEKDQPAVEIRVVDRGPGIPVDEQGHIFDAFYRGRRALQDQIHGTGLGLSLAKGIVEAHGGTIAVQSKPREGTEFIVRIPAAPPEFQDEFTHSFDRG